MTSPMQSPSANSPEASHEMTNRERVRRLEREITKLGNAATKAAREWQKSINALATAIGKVGQRRNRLISQRPNA